MNALRAARTGRYAVVDVETTGFSPTGDGVVEVACVLVQDGRVERRWSSLVNPLRPIPWRATDVHGITDDDVAQAPTLAELEGELVALCAGATVVAHNASFDLSFLTVLQSHPVLCMHPTTRIRPFGDTSVSIEIRCYGGVKRIVRSPMPRSPPRYSSAVSSGLAGERRSDLASAPRIASGIRGGRCPGGLLPSWVRLRERARRFGRR